MRRLRVVTSGGIGARGSAFATGLALSGRGRAAAWGLLILVASAGAPARAAVEVKASVDRTQVAAGEPFTLTVQVSGAQNVPTPDLGDLGNFRVQYLGPSTQMSIANGQVSRSVSYRYQLVAKRPGRFTLGPFGVDYQGRRHSTTPFQVRVSAERKAAPGEASQSGLRLLLVPAKGEIYVGERVPLEVKLYVPSEVSVDDLQYPVVAGDGVMMDKLGEPGQRDEIMGGQRYRTLRFQGAMVAVRPGDLQLTATIGLAVLTRRRGGLFGRDPFFDRFFGNTFAGRRPVELRAAPADLLVSPLPEAGRPAGFAGAVGRFDFAMRASPTDLDAGDPITVRMQITGRGNMNSVAPPAIPVDDRFRIYDALAVKDEQGPKRRVFEQVVIPKLASIAELPAARFSFFDPDAAAYRTIARGPIALAVRARPAGQMPGVMAPEDAAEPRPVPQPVGRDIVYIKDSPGRLRSVGPTFYESAWFYALQLAPVVVFGGALLLVRRRDRLAADPRLQRFRGAGREARRALATLGSETGGERFYDQLAGTVATYLGAKLDLPPGAVERERVLTRLAENKSAEGLQRDVDAFFRLVEQVRYAPNSAAAGERERALRMFRDIVDGLERGRRAEARFAGFAVGALLGTLTLAGLMTSPAWISPGVAAGPDAESERATGERQMGPRAAFFAGNAAYAAGNYAAAERDYEGVLGSGFESGPLYFNLGNAQFKSGRLGEAIASYERARRLLPREPDVRANLAYAQELADATPAAHPIWQRLVLPLAFGSTAAELAALASALWFAFWIALTLRLFVRRGRTAMGRAAWVLGFLYLFAAGSFGFRSAELELRRAAIVTAGGETQVRFEPSDSGTHHFPVRTGARLEVTDGRAGWLQVRRQDGRRGWLPAGAVTRLR